MKKLKFVLGFHNHQPIGNFDFVIEDAVERAYLPFLRVLEQHNIRVSLHNSGALLEWLYFHRPDVIEKIKVLVAAGKLEIIGGAFYEPIIAVLPDHDKRGQIQKMQRFIKDTFNFEAVGFWLAERIWEPHLPLILNEMGVKYVVVDDSHFKMAGFLEEELYEYYETEEQGRSVYIFPISQRLRYLIPFEEPSATIEFLREIYDTGKGSVVVMADDGEKFGIWPGTYDLVYRDGWLHRFFDELEANSDWLEVVRFDEVIKGPNAIKPRGNVYLPTASYMEMMEWALSTPRQEQFESLYHSSEVPDEVKQFMRGGFWRHFFHKYTESNLMHKRMLDVSFKVNEAISTNGLNAKMLEIRDELWRAQTNCPYWHGVFGGLYLPHLRSAVFEHLINAEKQINSEEYEEGDYLKTGENVIKVATPHQTIIINADRGASVMEWDYKQKNHNITNVMTRRRESYHNKVLTAAESSGQQESSKVKTIHDLVVLKEPDLHKKLIYDKWPRYSFKELFGKEISAETLYKSFVDMSSYTADTHLLASEKKENYYAVSFNVRSAEIEYKKSFAIFRDEAKLMIEYEILRAVQAYMAIELNLFLPARDKSLCYVEASNGEVLGIGELREIETETLKIIDNIKGYEAILKSPNAAKIALYPIETVSNSEAGFESVMQGLSVNVVYDIHTHNKIGIEVFLRER